MVTIQAMFPMLYKNEYLACGGFIRRSPQEFAGIEIVEKIAAKAARFPVRDFFPVESFQNYQCGNIGVFEYTVFKKYLALVTINCRDDVLRLVHYWYQFIHNQGVDLRTKNMADDFPILDPLIAPYFDEELLHDILRISLDSGKEEAYPYDYQWFAHFISIFLLSSKKSVIKRATTDKAIEKVLFGKPQTLPENVLSQISTVLRSNDYLFNDESSCLLYLIHVQGCKDTE
jgi:hypothetical protein